MGRSSTKQHHRAAHTLPSSPTHSSSSSSEFEFTVSISPRKSSPALCPADELFYKGQLLPLQLSPRLSMVRTLLLSSSSSSSSSATTSARDSSGSSSDFSSLPEGGSDSSRPSSVTDQDDELKRLHTFTARKPATASKSSYFSLPKLFRKDPKPREPSPAKRIISSSAKEVIRKYLKKVKPLYEKLSQKQQQQIGKTTVPTRTEIARPNAAAAVVSSSSCKGAAATETGGGGGFPQSFSGNLKYPASRTRTCAASSCPSSMRSSPSHSGVLTGSGFPASTRPNRRGTESAIPSFSSSSMEELQSAIQGAIAHCKNSMLQQQNKCSTSS